jgi:hypothetical protein
MFKKTLIALAAMGAVALSTAADARHRDRGRTQVVVSFGTPTYYGNHYGGYYNGYYDPYYRPVYYQPVYYQPYYQPRYRQRVQYYDPYYRPRHRGWKKRHYRRHHW